MELQQADPSVRRVFICYTRRALKEVEQFDRVLLERLRTLSNRYEVFRDQSPRADERIIPGDHYPTTLQRKLDSSVCCIVVLVPAIFESEECEKEVVHFEQRIARGERCFFYPVAFGKVDRAFRKPSPQHNSIGRILDKIDRSDFTGFWNLREDHPDYLMKVAEIADNIHLKVEQLLDGEAHEAPPPTAPLTAPVAGGAERETGRQAGRPGSRRWIAAGAGLLLMAAVTAALLPQGGDGWARIAEWLGPPPVGWAAVAAPVEVAAPVPLYDTPQSREPSGTLLPEEVDAGTRFERATIADVPWYRITLGDRVGYARADDIPEWLALDGPLELVMATPAYAAPRFGEPGAASGTVGPGEFRAGQADVSRVAAAAYRAVAWLRIDRTGRPTDFLLDADIPRWAEVARGNLGLIAEANASLQPVPGAPTRRLFPDAAISAVTEAEVGGAGWYRLAAGAASYYLPSSGPVERIVASWTDQPGLCLKGNVDDGRTYSGPRVDPRQWLRDFRRGTALSGSEPVQSAEVGGALWYRYRDGDLHHVPAATVAECALP